MVLSCGTAIQNEQMMGTQRLARDEALGNLEVASQDYGKNMQLAQYNMQNAIAGLRDKTQYDKDVYSERMKAAGARENASAVRSNKIICGELARQGLLDSETMKVDTSTEVLKCLER